jgi:hypothetical protein
MVLSGGCTLKVNFVFFLLLSVTLYGQSTSPVAKSAAKQPVKSASVQHAQWTETAQAFSGVTQKQFTDSGLAKLTPDEFVQLMLAVADSRQEAVEENKRLQVTYTCGPVPADYDKVKVYVDVSDKTPSELASGIRQRLRGMSDVEVVYSPIEADLGVGLLGFENELQTGRKTGYSVSVVTYDPCKGSLGSNEWSIRMLNNQFIVTDATASGVVESILANIDTNDLENTRKLHAAIKSSGRRK